MGGQSRAGGKAKPNTVAQSADRKAQKAAWEAQQAGNNDKNDKSKYVSDDDDDNATKRRVQEAKKSLADAKAAAGKKGAMSLGNQGIKRSGKK